MRIIVTGASGQLGSALRKESKNHPAHTYLFLSHHEFPIDDPQRIQEVFSAWQPDLCINAAAYTAVDKAESDAETAFRINADAVGMLAASCREHGVRLVHISTDYVFPGSADHPYTEDEKPNPQSVYGASKYKGEQLAMLTLPDCIIIRTSWVYYEEGKNFVKTMIRLMAEKSSVGVVDDQWGSPTYAGDLASCILNIADSGEWVPGVYHYSNSGAITWHTFALSIREILGSSCEVRAITSAEFPTPVKRPAYSVLDTSKIQRVFHVDLIPWRQSLEACILRIQSQTA